MTRRGRRRAQKTPAGGPADSRVCPTRSGPAPWGRTRACATGAQPCRTGIEAELTPSVQRPVALSASSRNLVYVGCRRPHQVFSIPPPDGRGDVGQVVSRHGTPRCLCKRFNGSCLSLPKYRGTPTPSGDVSERILTLRPSLSQLPRSPGKRVIEHLGAQPQPAHPVVRTGPGRRAGGVQTGGRARPAVHSERRPE